MPIPLLIALLIAFGMDLPGDDVPAPAVSFRLMETLGGILLIAALSFGLGGWVAAQGSQFGYASGRVFRRYMRGSRILTVAGLAIYAWIIYLVGWPRLVLSDWGLQGYVLVDDLALLLPYFAIQIISWSGLYLAEHALHDSRAFPRLPRYLALKARQTAGLVLPVVLVFLIRLDVCSRLWPRWHQSPAAEPIELAVLGISVRRSHRCSFAWPGPRAACRRAPSAIAWSVPLAGSASGSMIFWSGTRGISWSTPA